MARVECHVSIGNSLHAWAGVVVAGPDRIPTGMSKTRNGRLIGKHASQQGHGDVAHPNPAFRRPFQPTSVGVTMENERDAIAVDWLFQPARTDERINLGWFPFGRLLNGGVVQERDHRFGPQPCERRFELQCFVHRLVHELLDDVFTPRTERPRTEAAAESLDSRNTDAFDLTGIAVGNQTPASARIWPTSASLPDSKS